MSEVLPYVMACLSNISLERISKLTPPKNIKKLNTSYQKLSTITLTSYFNSVKRAIIMGNTLNMGTATNVSSHVAMYQGRDGV